MCAQRSHISDIIVTENENAQCSKLLSASLTGVRTRAQGNARWIGLPPCCINTRNPLYVCILQLHDLSTAKLLLTLRYHLHPMRLTLWAHHNPCRLWHRARDAARQPCASLCKSQSVRVTWTSGGLDVLSISPAEELGPGLPDMRGSLPGLGLGRFACALHTMIVHLWDNLHALNIPTIQMVCCNCNSRRSDTCRRVAIGDGRHALDST